jgi:hypothetical protein
MKGKRILPGTRMTFEDEAKEIGYEFLYLIGGNLRERSKNIRKKFGVYVPYSSFDKQWDSLVSKLGLIESVRKILVECTKVLTMDEYRVLNKSVDSQVPQAEANLVSCPIYNYT